MSQSELSIKGYVHLKILHLKFWQLKIYDKSIQCKDSSIKYTLKVVTAKKFGQKIKV